MSAQVRLLGAAEIRALAVQHDVRPTKQRGQNFVIDPNTVRRIVRAAELTETDVVLEVGPGLGSLTLALLEVAQSVTAIELDAALANALPGTLAQFAPEHADRVRLVHGDALRVTGLPGPPPTAFVANLPYNVSVPVLLHLLHLLPSLRRGLVMVQAEVADRLAASPGSKVYGVPSAKAAWYAEVKRAGAVGRNVFWPAPNVDSGLVALTATAPPPTSASREQVFALVDAAFAQRRKTLRAALRPLPLADGGSLGARGTDALDRALSRADLDPQVRGEQLSITAFAQLASALGEEGLVW